MSEYVWTTYTIGGELSKQGLEELEALTEDMEGSLVSSTLKAKDTFQASGECNYGNHDELEKFCKERKLTYLKTYSSSAEFAAGGEFWSPTQAMEFPADEDGERIIRYWRLQEYAKDGLTLEQVIKELTLPEVPPLVTLSELEEKVLEATRSE